MSKKTSFIRTTESVTSLRLDFIIAILPSIIWSFIRFGVSAFITVVTSVVTACIADVLINFLLKSKLKAPSLYSAYYGIIFGAILYDETDILLTVFGSLLTVLLIYILGGVGKSFVFAPVAARLLIFNFLPYRVNKPADLPIEILYNGELPGETLYDLVLGMSKGAIGTVSVLAILWAFVYLWIRKSGDLKSSLSYIAALCILFFAFPAFQGRGVESAAFELFSGEILFAAAFILPDYGSSPNSTLLKYIAGIVCGLLTFTFRKVGYVADSVFLSILCTNMVVYVTSTISNHIKEVKYEKQSS